MCYTWIRNILHECINRLDRLSKIFLIEKIYRIYFFSLLYAFVFVFVSGCRGGGKAY